MKKITVLYHNDLDGKCCAAIIDYYYKNEIDTNLTFISFDYEKDYKVPKEVYKCDMLYIVDCTLDPNTMTDLFENYHKNNFIWIDHHISSIMNNNSSIYGTRLPGPNSACYLTWIDLYGYTDIPDAVKYISDRDVWSYKWGKLTIGFTEWLASQDNSVENKKMWYSIFENRNIGKHIDDGMIMYNSRIKMLKDDVDRLSYESEINGVKCLKMNCTSLYSISDVCALMIEKGYEVAWSWYKAKEMKYHSLRSNGNIDVSEIAKKFGGGGHKNAAGFIT